jgi:hypothetical protein
MPALFFFFVLRKPAAEARGASVLLVTIDTLRADHVGLYGGRGAATPHLTPWAPAGSSSRRRCRRCR